MGFVDTHVHLHFPDFEEDQDEVMSRAQKAGVELFINVGTDVGSSKKALALAHKHKHVLATAGIHPHDAKEATPEAMSEIKKLLGDSRVVAIGEVGLDFFRDHSPQEDQKRILIEFLDFYQELEKPLILHCRDAYEAMEKLLRQEVQPPILGVMHCFSSDQATMKRFLDLGFYISFAGPLTYKKNDALRDACRACPIDRLLLETDAPFLPPQTKRGKRNESSYMIETAETAAELHGLSLEELGVKTSQNARNLFQ